MTEIMARALPHLVEQIANGTVVGEGETIHVAVGGEHLEFSVDEALELSEALLRVGRQMPRPPPEKE